MTDHAPQNDAPYSDAAAQDAMRCADCAMSDSLAHDAVPVDQMPLTAEALAGFPNGVPSSTGVDRKRFLQTGIMGLASVYGASKIDWQQAFEAAVAEGAVANSMLVVIYLNGGNDGLNTFVPTGTAYADYIKARPTIGRLNGPSAGGKIGSIPMPGTAGELSFSAPLIPTAPLVGLDTLWGTGTGGVGSDLALFPAADYTPPNLSHFESRDFWFAGLLKKSQTGWLGRWLDAHGSDDNPLQAVSLDSSISKQIRTLKKPVAAVGGLNGVNFQLPGVPTTDTKLNDEIARLAAVQTSSGNDQLARTRGVYDLTVKVSNSLSPLAGQVNAAAGYPNSALSTKLKLAAQLLSAGLGTRIVTLDWGGFDTHGNQIASQDPQLAALGQALPAFAADLKARGIGDRVTTLVFSEFGRRIGESDSGGTDHGAGGPMMVMGPAVRGGIAGEFPGLATTDRGNLSVATDFRAVYWHLLTEWLGTDRPELILPGGPFPGFKRLDGATTLFK